MATGKMIIQIYEIQTPFEAEAVISLGVDHVGSVIVSEKDWKLRSVRETIRVAKKNAAVSSLITLYNDVESVFKTLDYYRPDIVHFCEALVEQDERGLYVHDRKMLDRLVVLQEKVGNNYPEIQIMRAIPIARNGLACRVDSLGLADIFEPVSDFFLTDTLLVSSKTAIDDQPEAGFVGITGKTCDWDTARKLVKKSRIPVILAGGMSPENAREGVLKVIPAGVDSCTCTNEIDASGAPVRFKKDMAKVGLFVESVRKAELELRAENVN